MDCVKGDNGHCVACNARMPGTRRQACGMTPLPPPLTCQGEHVKILEGRKECGCGVAIVEIIQCTKYGTTAAKTAIGQQYMDRAGVDRCCVRCVLRNEHEQGGTL